MQTVARQVATNRRLIVPKIAMELYSRHNIILALECQLRFSAGVIRGETRAARNGAANYTNDHESFVLIRVIRGGSLFLEVIVILVPLSCAAPFSALSGWA